MVVAFATTDPSSSETRAVVDAIRAATPSGVLVGGPVAENHDLANTLALTLKRPVVVNLRVVPSQIESSD
jgi:hypothetical protein